MGGGTEATHNSGTAGMVPSENPTLTIKGAGPCVSFVMCVCVCVCVCGWMDVCVCVCIYRMIARVMSLHVLAYTHTKVSCMWFSQCYNKL